MLAPNRFVVDWLQEHYIERILELVDGNDTKVVVEVGSRDKPAATAPAPAVARSRAATAPTIASRLSPSFTFASFVEGVGARVAVLCNPNNPTGALVGTEYPRVGIAHDGPVVQRIQQRGRRYLLQRPGTLL